MKNMLALFLVVVLLKKRKRIMRILSTTLFTICVLVSLFFIVESFKERPQGYGEHLEGFDYPYPTADFTFTSQGQKLTMGYMDVAPIGESNGHTVIALHGKNFCGATWEKTIDTLIHEGYRVIAPDQIGFCRSTKPEGYQFSLNQLAANTHALLEAQGVEKAIVMGHSMGGMLATRYALMYPQNVEKLVLVNPIGLEDWQAKGVPYATIDDMYKAQLKITYNKIKNYQSKFYYKGGWKPEYDKWVDMLYGMYEGSGKQHVAYNQAQTSEMIFTQPIAHEFANVQVPTLLLIGQMDRTAPGANRTEKDLAETLGNYPELGRKTAAEIPNAVLVEFPSFGHSPQVEAPDVFHKALLEELPKGL